MKIRTLCGALTLLLFAAPLSASLCGFCAPDHCMPAGETSEPVEPRASSHCHKAEEPKEEPKRAAAPCHDAVSTMASSECCALTTSPEPENAAIPAGSVAFEIALEPAVVTELPAAEHERSETRRDQPPCPTPRPLYTLHAAFLI